MSGDATCGADDRWNTMWDGGVLDDDADGRRRGDVMAARFRRSLECDEGWGC